MSSVSGQVCIVTCDPMIFLTTSSGSCLHAVRALEHPRWEDYNYEYLDPGVKSKLYWLGDGSTYNEKYMVGDTAWYLNDDELDIPPGKYAARNI